MIREFTEKELVRMHSLLIREVVYLEHDMHLLVDTEKEPLLNLKKLRDKIAMYIKDIIDERYRNPFYKINLLIDGIRKKQGNEAANKIKVEFFRCLMVNRHSEHQVMR